MSAGFIPSATSIANPSAAPGLQSGRTFQDRVADYRVRLLSAAVLGGMALGLICAVPIHDPFNLHDPCSLTAGLLMILGLGVRSWAAGVLRKGRALTMVGPYSLCRHPLYVGTTLLFAGTVLIYPGLAIGVPCFTLSLFLLVLTIDREEQRMAQRYERAWLSYAARTPRFVPDLAVEYRAGEWTLDQWMQSREYNAIIATGVSLFLVKLVILAS